MTENEPQFLHVGDDDREIAVRHRKGRDPGLFWLSGFRSDMAGAKAVAIDDWAAGEGRQSTQMDYSGHGESGGQFEKGTIGRWSEEVKAVFDHMTSGRQIIIGSSMGGWIALLLAKAHLAEVGRGNGRIQAIVLIAPAPDFTEDLMWAKFPDEIKETIKTKGRFEMPSAYTDEPTVVTRRLIEDGREHLVLRDTIETGAPVHIIQGIRDPDIPYDHALRIVDALSRDDVVVTLVKDGDHRLSRPEDIKRLIDIVSSY